MVANHQRLACVGSTFLLFLTLSGGGVGSITRIGLSTLVGGSVVGIVLVSRFMIFLGHLV